MQSRPRVALLIETSNAYARELLYGIRSYLKEHQSWSIYLAEHGRGDVLPAWLRAWKGDGIIARVENQTIAEGLLATGLPTVDVSFGLERSPFPRVVTDSHAASRLAADHLLERGFQHFGYCGEARYHWSNLRSRVFFDHVTRSGSDCQVFQCPASRNESLAWERELELIAAWIRGLPKPVGIMACWDIRGQQVLEACRRIGVAVPDEVSVIGVHNDELLCDLCDPPLSSVIPNARRAGHEAAALLDRMIGGESVSAQTILLEPIGIATRQSTDVVALTDAQISKAVRFIRERACEGITVDDVLRAVPMSRTVFERRFKKLLNRTPHDQILRVRIERVRTMLANTDLTLAQIAERTGFGHIEYLSVAFKRATGESPSRFRARFNS
jgi:LacI family transcriptional regulator